MKKLLAGVAAAAVLVAGVAYADAISDRRQLMKNNGAAAGVLVKTMKGEMAYDPAAVLTAFQTINDDMKKFGDLFPAGSDKGDTHASPKIWEEMDQFKALIQKMIDATDAAIKAAPQDKDAMVAVFQPIGGICGECHKDFRLPLN